MSLWCGFCNENKIQLTTEGVILQHGEAKQQLPETDSTNVAASYDYYRGWMILGEPPMSMNIVAISRAT